MVAGDPRATGKSNQQYCLLYCKGQRCNVLTAPWRKHADGVMHHSFSLVHCIITRCCQV